MVWFHIGRIQLGFDAFVAQMAASYAGARLGVSRLRLELAILTVALAFREVGC